jgi:hypothetical protein
MANDQERGSPEDLGQDPFVERRRPDPSQPPERVRILEGLLGDSEREGYKRLYFTRELDNYAEFRVEDVVFSETIPPEQAPLAGLEATRVGIRWDATIEYTRSRTPRTVDEFDLDIRLAALGGRRAEGLAIPESRFEPCEDCTGRLTGCGTITEETCRTQCDQLTCQTCQTRCDQPTCQGTCQTCQTQCNQPTCQTCQTQCNQPTCQGTCRTCQTQCGGCPPTRLQTCENTHCFTCRSGCEPF